MGGDPNLHPTPRRRLQEVRNGLVGSACIIGVICVLALLGPTPGSEGGVDDATTHEAAPPLRPHGDEGEAQFEAEYLRAVARDEPGELWVPPADALDLARKQCDLLDANPAAGAAAAVKTVLEWQDGEIAMQYYSIQLIGLKTLCPQHRDAVMAAVLVATSG